MARGYCPNQECPNIDVLDTEHPCPTCGREVREATPKEYWRTRTIKMMHAHEIAEIAEIQEVARRAMGEASIVPKAQEPVSPSMKQEEPGEEEIDSIEAEVSGEPEGLLSEKDLAGVDEPMGEVEEIQHPGGLMETAIPSESLDLPLESLRIGEMDEIMVHGQMAEIEEVEPPGKPNSESVELAPAEEESGPQLGESRAPESEAQEIEKETSSAEDFMESKAEIETAKVEAFPTESREQEETFLENISEAEEVPFVEGLLESQAANAPVESGVALSEEGEEAEQGASEEASGPESVDRFDGREEETDVPFEVTAPESPVWRRDELIAKQPAEEASFIERLPDDGGVERPASAVRIITFREGSTEIGICPYCGRFIRGSDLSRHKLKHRVRNVLGFQGEG